MTEMSTCTIIGIILRRENFSMTLTSHSATDLTCTQTHFMHISPANALQCTYVNIKIITCHNYIHYTIDVYNRHKSNACTGEPNTHFHRQNILEDGFSYGVHEVYLLSRNESLVSVHHHTGCPPQCPLLGNMYKQNT